jgi:hypothetical protein
MARLQLAAACLTSVLVLNLAGCPLSQPSDVTIDGLWSGTLSYSSTQSLNGVDGVPTQGTRDMTISFDANGVPTSLPIWGFVGADTQTVTISQVGESTTVNYSSDGLDVELVVTVTSASYPGDSAHVELDVQYSATGGALMQDGDATITIDASVNGEQLVLGGTAVYQVPQTAGSVYFETGDKIVCTGTLTKR